MKVNNNNNNNEENTMTKTWEKLSDVEQDRWREEATEYLIKMAWLPLSDDVWATDKYTDQIEAKAIEMFESHEALRLDALAN